MGGVRYGKKKNRYSSATSANCVCNVKLCYNKRNKIGRLPLLVSTLTFISYSRSYSSAVIDSIATTQEAAALTFAYMNFMKLNKEDEQLNNVGRF